MSQTGFPGIQPAMLEYFVGIALNNYREYFLSTHKDYEQNVKKPLYALAEELVPYALKIDDDMEQLPRRIVSRIRRDTRFTKDKSPYRSHMWLSFHPMSKPKWACFGLYYDISPDCSCYGGGFYDRFLSREPDHPTVALCYDFQVMEKIETESFDIPVDVVLWA